jgi:hypothetical protein
MPGQVAGDDVLRARGLLAGEQPGVVGDHRGSRWGCSIRTTMGISSASR